MSCGTQIERACPNCGEAAPPQARFCMSCGTALEGTAPPAVERPAEQPPEERRQVTVLFADLSGYTAVAEQMDPETVKTLVGGALRRLGQEVTRYGGAGGKYNRGQSKGPFCGPPGHPEDEEGAAGARPGTAGGVSEVHEEPP